MPPTIFFCAGLAVVPDRERRCGQGEHHDREEAGHERPRCRVAVRNRGDVAGDDGPAVASCTRRSWNHGNELRMWCRPSGMSSRLAVP